MSNTQLIRDRNAIVSVVAQLGGVEVSMAEVRLRAGEGLEQALESLVNDGTVELTSDSEGRVLVTIILL